MTRKKKLTTKYCPNCRKEVPVTRGAGLFSAFIGMIMIFFGGWPGKKQSMGPRCTYCDTEIPAE